MARARLCSAGLINSIGRVLLTAPAETHNRQPVRTFHFHEAPYGKARSDRAPRPGRSCEAVTICTPFPERELNAETNLALDLGFESMSMVELLAEVEYTLGVTIDIEVAVFAELTIAELADLVTSALQKKGADRLINLI